jgi:mannitol/fructose-specific phosphotransferase system IIA component (Ntr-type)
MPLATLLTPEVIAVAPPWRSFPATIAGLLDLMVAAGTLPPGRRDAVRDAVSAREAEGSTAVFEIGVGVPHARVPGLSGPIAAMAVSADGLYEAVPTVRIRIVTLLVSPAAATEAHLKLLAGVATSLRTSALRTRLLVARDPQAVLAALRDPTS